MLKTSSLMDSKRYGTLFSRSVSSVNQEQYGEKPFIVRRWDNDITIFHNKYIGEICSFPNSKASAMQAQIKVSFNPDHPTTTVLT